MKVYIYQLHVHEILSLVLMLTALIIISYLIGVKHGRQQQK